MNAKSSFYKDFIRLEGFGDTATYDVKLYAVGRNLKRSTPVILQVKPLPPPIWGVFKSLDIQEDFGGLTLSFENIDSANITINVEALDSIGNWKLADVLYTSQKAGTFSVRGLKPVPQPFRIFVKDRWGNQSEVLATELTPLYEEQIDKGNFRELNMPGDPAWFGSTRVSYLWNNTWSGSGSGSGSWFRTDNGSGIPNHINFDMGVTAKLSRYIFWQRGTVSEHNLLYTAGSPREWEVWGSNNPDPQGSYDGWVKLMDCRIDKPSGLPIGNNAEEDIRVAAAGHEFRFPVDAPPVRYIRIRVNRTFQVTDYFWMSELSFFGQIQ